MKSGWKLQRKKYSPAWLGAVNVNSMVVRGAAAGLEAIPCTACAFV